MTFATSTTLEERRAVQRERQRRYRERHPERAAQVAREWRERNPDKIAEKNKRWRDSDPERARDAHRRSRVKHRDKRRAEHRAWEWRNKERVKASRRARYASRAPELRSRLNERRRERKMQLVAMLGGKCMDCGAVPHLAAFEFDHVGTKTRNISLMLNSGRWEAILEEVRRCQLVCANCHRVRTAERTGAV